MYHNLLKVVKWVVLALVVVTLLAMAPAQTAQAQSCGNTCLDIRLKVFCTSGAVPAFEGTEHYFAEIIRSSPWAIVGSPWLVGGGVNQQNQREYVSLITNAQHHTQYQIRWTQDSGPWAYMWSAWMFHTTGTTGTTTSWVFLLQKSC